MKTALVISIFLSLISLASHAETSLDVSLFHDGDIVLSRKDFSKGVGIRLKIVGGPATGELEVITSSVRYNQTMYPDLIGAITGTVDQQGELLLKIDSTRISTPGKYEVAFSFKTGTSSDDLNIPLVIPQGKLKIPAQLSIEMTQGWCTDELNEPAPTLSITESTGQHSVDVTFPCVVRFSGNASKNFGLAFEEKQMKILAGKSKDMRYRVFGDFPLGTFKANCQIAVDGQQEMQTIEITVKNIITRYIIIPILFAGIFLGWILRTFILRRKELLEQKIQAGTLIEAIRKAVIRNNDTTFRDDCTRIINALENIVRSKSEAAKIKNAIATAQEDQKQAFERFSSRQSKFDHNLSNILTAVSSTYDLPEPINDTLANYKPAFEELRNEGDFAIREKELAKQLEALAKELTVFISHYHEIQNTIITPGKIPLPGTVEEQYSNSIRLETPLDFLEMPADAEKIQLGLRTWNTNFLAWRKAIKTFTRSYYRYFTEVLERLKRSLASKSDLAKQKQELDKFNALADLPDTYLNVDRHILQLMNTLSEGWDKIFKSLDIKGSATYHNALAKVEYLEALKELESSNHLMYAGTLVKPINEAPAPGEPFHLQDNKSIARIRLLSIQSAKPVTIDYDLQNEKRGWQLFENLLVAILTCLVAFAVIAPKFDGSLASCITILFVGFSMDITTDSLLEYSKKLIK